MYRDRTDAGRRLAGMLGQHKGPQTLVLALPRGGVVVGFEVARELGARLETLVVRKLGAPSQPEFGFGAIGPGGSLVLDQQSVAMLGLSRQDVQGVIDREKKEMDRRQRVYLNGRQQPDVKGSTVIIVDDGMATGVTARVAVQSVRQAQAEKVVLAVPVAPAGADIEFAGLVDEFVCPEMPAYFHAIGQFYDSFEQTTDEEVLALLEQARQSHAQQQRGAA